MLFPEMDDNYPGLSEGIVPVDAEPIYGTDDSSVGIKSIEDWLYEYLPIKQEMDSSIDFDDVIGQFSFDTPMDRKEWMVQDSVTRRFRSPRLFEFLILLLRKPHYESYASFTDQLKGIFQIHRPDKVAELWQAVKSRQSNQKMTYDKFARAIRWYYKSNIMQKTNTRYTFQFSTKTLRTYFVDENNNTTMSVPA